MEPARSNQPVEVISFEPIYDYCLNELNLDRDTMRYLRGLGWCVYALPSPVYEKRRIELRWASPRTHNITFRAWRGADGLWEGNGALSLFNDIQKYLAQRSDDPHIIAKKLSENNPNIHGFHDAWGQKKAPDTGDELKKDDNKPRFELLPPEPLFALADLYTQGAKKYSDRGWEKGMSWGRIFGAMCRHAWKFWRGETYDQETGAHHMIAVAWNAFALYTYAVRKIGTDDRHVS